MKLERFHMVLGSCFVIRQPKLQAWKKSSFFFCNQWWSSFSISFWVQNFSQPSYSALQHYMWLWEWKIHLKSSTLPLLAPFWCSLLCSTETHIYLSEDGSCFNYPLLEQPFSASPGIWTVNYTQQEWVDVPLFFDLAGSISPTSYMKAQSVHICAIKFVLQSCKLMISRLE